jgi:hypothetical protein
VTRDGETNSLPGNNVVVRLKKFSLKKEIFRWRIGSIRTLGIIAEFFWYNLKRQRLKHNPKNVFWRKVIVLDYSSRQEEPCVMNGE